MEEECGGQQKNAPSHPLTRDQGEVTLGFYENKLVKRANAHVLQQNRFRLSKSRVRGLEGANKREKREIRVTHRLNETRLVTRMRWATATAKAREIR